ncbi:hypothetical protein AMK59_6978, partial [Oryctes borbonicus]
MDFIIDTAGTGDLSTLKQSEEPVKNVRHEGIQKLLERHKDSLEPTIPKSPVNRIVEQEKSTLAKFVDEMVLANKKSKNNLNLTTHKHDTKELLKKSIITPDFEKLQVVPSTIVSKRKLKQLKKKEIEKTKGKKWFHLPATEMSDEVKTDLEILRMRSVLDPKHFYKKNDLEVLPKYFQVGKVLDSPLEHYNNRLTKKERKRTLVDELLADAEFNKYNKRKYHEIIQEKQKTHYKAYRQAKKLKRK